MDGSTLNSDYVDLPAVWNFSHFLCCPFEVQGMIIVGV